MCNDFGNHIPYSDYLAAFSQTRIPVRWPTSAPNLEPAKTSGRPTRLRSFADSKTARTNSPNSGGAFRRLAPKVHQSSISAPKDAGSRLAAASCRPRLDFLFRPEQARTPVGVLSGGERARLTLARAFARPSNLLVLDEPTNDLDLETLDLLQERLAEYPGTVLLVSHDRDFLDRVVTSVIATEGNGRWIEYAGGYTDMLAQRASAGRGTPPAKASVTKRPRPVTEVRAQPAARARRMSFNDQRALEMLTARVAALQTQIAGLNDVLADPNLHARDPGRFGATTGALAIARDELAAAEEQWLTLEMLREEIDKVGPT